MNDFIDWLKNFLTSSFMLGGMGGIIGVLALQLRSFYRQGRKWNFSIAETIVIFFLGSLTSQLFGSVVPDDGIILNFIFSIDITKNACLGAIGAASPFIWIFLIDHGELIFFNFLKKKKILDIDKLKNSSKTRASKTKNPSKTNNSKEDDKVVKNDELL